VYAQSRYSKEFLEHKKYQGKIQCKTLCFSFVFNILVFCFVKFFLKATQLQKMVEDLEENTVEIRNAKGLLIDHIKVKDKTTKTRSLLLFLRFE